MLTPREINCLLLADLTFKAFMRGKEGFDEFRNQMDILREAAKLDIKSNNNSQQVKDGLREAISAGIDEYVESLLR
jgi:hypothetical protein